MKTKYLLILLIILLISTGPLLAEEPERGGTFRWGILGSPRGMFNPVLSTEIFDNYVVNRVFDGLIAIDRYLAPVPLIAENWEFSEDGLSLTFYLRQGIRFHDGVELTAADVAFTYEIICHPDYTGVRYGDFSLLLGAAEYKNKQAEGVVGIVIIDDYTVRFTTKEPFMPLLTRFTRGILPRHLLVNVPVKELELADFNQNPIGAGPFRFVAFNYGQNVVLERFEDYYRDDKPYLDQIIIMRIADDARPVWLRQERIDYTFISPQQFPLVESYEYIDVYNYDSLGYQYLCFNLRQEVFEDRKVRQAIVYATDRESLVELLLEGFGTVANSPLPPASWAYTDEGINDYPYNPDLARQLLQEAGWRQGTDGIFIKDGIRFEFELLVSQGLRLNEDIAVFIKENLADIGIQVNLSFLEFSSLVDRVDRRDFDAFMLGWDLGIDPDPFLIWHSESPWNDAGFQSKKSDELIEMARREIDIEKRKDIYAEWQRLINREVPNMFLFYHFNLAAINQRVRGINTEPGPLGLIEDFADIWISNPEKE